MGWKAFFSMPIGWRKPAFFAISLRMVRRLMRKAEDVCSAGICVDHDFVSLLISTADGIISQLRPGVLGL
jgi:hypothetical protein